MAKKITQATVHAKTVAAAAGNKNFRARITFKSGASQDFLIVAVSTNAFDNMRTAFLGYLNSGAPKSGYYGLYPGSVVVDWRDVSAFHDWTD